MKYFKDQDTFVFNQDKCTGCGRCVEVCPHEVFIIENRKAVPVNADRCMECGACSKNCAFDAVYVKSGVGCAAAVITGLIKGTEPMCGCDETTGGCC